MPDNKSKNKDRLFDSKDVGIISDALQIMPELEIAAYATKLAKGKLKFPLKSHDDIKPLFEAAGDPIIVRNREYTFEQVRKFLPKEVFPILDISDFLGKTFLGFCWGLNYHSQERAYKRVKSPSSFKPVPPSPPWY